MTGVKVVSRLELRNYAKRTMYTFPLPGLQELLRGVAIDVAVAGVVVQAGVGGGGVGGQLVVEIVEGDGWIGLHLATENAGEAVGEVDAVFHNVCV